MTDDQHRDALLAEISKHEALLTRLESDRERARERLAALRAALVALGSSAVFPTECVKSCGATHHLQRTASRQ
jgi:hypothetical protein